MYIGLDDIAAAVGRRPHVRWVDVAFYNPDVDILSVPETVSPIGGMVAFRGAAAVVELVSSSAADAAAETGARTVTIEGLDADYNEVSETITLNGTTAVVGAVEFFRINRVIVASAGTGKVNAGNITVRDAGAGTTRSYVAVGRGVSEVGTFTVPAGHKVLSTGWTVASRTPTGASRADVEFFETKNGVRRASWATVVANETAPASLGSAHVFEEKTDIEVVVTFVLNDNTIVAFHGHGLLIGPNADL